MRPLGGRGYFPSPGSDQLALVCERGRGGTRGHRGLGKYVADVAIDGLLAQGQLPCDRFIGAPLGNQPQHLQFALREPVPAAVCRRARGTRSLERRDCRQVRGGAESLEYLACARDLHAGRLDITQRQTGTGQKHTQARSQVRRPQLLPGAEGPARRSQHALRIAVGQLHRAVRRDRQSRRAPRY